MLHSAENSLATGKSSDRRPGAPAAAARARSVHGNQTLLRMQGRGARATPLPASRVLQRKCAACNEEQEATLQRRAASAGEAATAPPIVHEVLASPGQPLDAATRADMEPRFGHDFSQVRVHADAKAAESAQAVNALAYTVGRNVVFGDKQYGPGTGAGRRLLAHELTHVVQQQASVHLQDGMSEAGDSYERDADRVASLVAQGQSAEFPINDISRANDATSARRTPTAVAAPLQMQEANELAPADKTRVATREPVPLIDKPAKLHLFVDIDVKELGFSDLTEGNVGHTWVSLEYRDPTKVPPTTHHAHRTLLQNGGKYSDPMGFWPAVNEGIYYSVNPLAPWVKGWMRHPDTAHQGSEKATETWEISRVAMDNVINFAESKRNAFYSVYDYNCTTFAKEAVEASGMSAPTMSSLGFCLPNAAYDGIKARQEKGVGTTSVKDFTTGKESVVVGPDETAKKR